MRILYFIESGGPGGAEQVVVQLARGSIERGDEVAVATLRCGWLTEQLAQRGIAHMYLPSKRRLDLGFPYRLAKVLRNFDVLHTHLFDSAVYGALAAALARKPHIATEHGDIHHITKRKFSQGKLQVLRLCKTRFTAVSHFTREALLSKGIAAENVEVVGNPIRPEQFSRLAAPDDSSFAASIGVDVRAAPFVWVHVANHRPVKDQQTLLRGFAKALPQSSRPQCLLLVGDGPERENLAVLAKELAIEQQVYFLGFRSDVQKVLSISDGAILTSHSEALPMSLLEAGALGLVLLSSEVGGVGDIIIPEETGLLFPKGDCAKLAAQMVRLINEPQLSEKLQSQVVIKIANDFALSVILDRYKERYDAVLSRYGKTPHSKTVLGK